MEGCVSTFNNVYTGGNCLPMHCLALTHVIGDTRLYNCVAIATINTSHNINTSLNSTKCLSPHLEKMRMLNLKISKVINVTKFYHFNAHKKILFFLHYPICSEKLQQPSTQILTTVKSFLEIIPAFTVRTAFGTNKLLHYSNV